MTPYADMLSREPIRFAPFAGLIGNLIDAVPRYAAETAPSPRLANRNVKKQAFALATERLLLAILAERGPMLTKEVRDAAGMANTTTYNRLDALLDDGLVKRTTVANGVMWEAV